MNLRSNIFKAQHMWQMYINLCMEVILAFQENAVAQFINDLAQMLACVNLCLTNITMIALHIVKTCCRSPGVVQVWDNALSGECLRKGEVSETKLTGKFCCQGMVKTACEMWWRGVCQVWLQALGCEADRQLQMPLMASEQSGRKRENPDFSLR